MKKLLSLALILALVATLTTSVFADTTRVVGKTGETPAYENGVTYGDFEANVPTVNVGVYVTSGAYESRYAVDIEYSEIKFDVAASNMVWDVTTMKYVVKNSGSTLTKPGDQTITVKNYSDQSVYMSAAVTPATGLDDSPMKVDVDCPAVVGKATAGSGSTNGTVTTEEITISVNLKNSTDTWNDVANYFATRLSGTATLQVATVTITISKDAPITTP